MCDTVVVMTGEGVLFAKNSDRDANEAQAIRWHPAANYERGALVRCTWSTIPQVKHTHAVMLSQPWWAWGAEMGTNEHGLVVGNEPVFTRRHRGPRPESTELLGIDLVRLALERASTAQEGVEVIVSLLSKHGQGGSCSFEHPRHTYDSSFLLADAEHAYVLETAGRAWAAERINKGSWVISNGLTIPSFARVQADRLRGHMTRSVTHRQRTQAAAAQVRYPTDLMALLRDHNGPSPRWSPAYGGLDAPCAHAGGAVVSAQTTASWVADLRHGGAGHHWVTATSAPCTSLFQPVRIDRPEPLLGHAHPGSPLSNHYDPEHLWWRHEVLHRRAIRNHPAAMAHISGARDKLQHRLLNDCLDPDAVAAEIERFLEAAVFTITNADAPDRRPSWLRALWSRLDRAAGIPAAHPTAHIDQPLDPLAGLDLTATKSLPPGPRLSRRPKRPAH